MHTGRADGRGPRVAPGRRAPGLASSILQDRGGAGNTVLRCFGSAVLRYPPRFKDARVLTRQKLTRRAVVVPTPEEHQAAVAVGLVAMRAAVAEGALPGARTGVLVPKGIEGPRRGHRLGGVRLAFRVLEPRVGERGRGASALRYAGRVAGRAIATGTFWMPPPASTSSSTRSIIPSGCTPVSGTCRPTSSRPRTTKIQGTFGVSRFGRTSVGCATPPPHPMRPAHRPPPRSGGGR